MSPTYHLNKRIRERVGINKKSIPKFLKKAELNGLNYKDLSGDLKKYVDNVLTSEKIECVLVYNRYLIIRDDLGVGITILHLPRELNSKYDSLKKGKLKCLN